MPTCGLLLPSPNGEGGRLRPYPGSAGVGARGVSINPRRASLMAPRPALFGRHLPALGEGVCWRAGQSVRDCDEYDSFGLLREAPVAMRSQQMSAKPDKCRRSWQREILCRVMELSPTDRVGR